MKMEPEKSLIDLHSYDKILIQLSGGKDSSCCLLYLLSQGVPKDKIELWHQDIDGFGKPFFDWPVTRDYCVQFARAFGVPIYFQWKEGGFKGEMLRKDEPTKPVWFQLPDGDVSRAGGKSANRNTRMKFPQCSFDLSVRWCSSYLKINVCSCAITNDERFRGKRTLVVSGERAEESHKRAGYAVFEPDRADLRNGKENRRHVDRFRPLLHWKERQVWELLEKYRVRVHPCYYMGWPRCSCLFCIFGDADQFASAAKISPDGIDSVIGYEDRFECTIKRNCTLPELISSGRPYSSITVELEKLAMGEHYELPVIMPPGEKWILPAGAYGKSCQLM